MQQPKFEIGDRVTYAAPELPYQKKRGIGEVVRETATHYFIIWADDPEMKCPHLKESAFFAHEMLVKAELAGNGKSKNHIQPLLPVEINVSGTDKKSVPETSSRRYGHIEDYVVKGRKGQTHQYLRYVYFVSGTHKKHHIPNRQVESIETLWRSGATAKEICLALGKSSK